MKAKLDTNPVRLTPTAHMTLDGCNCLRRSQSMRFDRCVFHAAALAHSAGKGLPIDSAAILICASRERGMPILRQL